MNRSAARIVAGTLCACAMVAASQAQPACLINLDRTLYRVNATETGTFEAFPNQPGTIIGMTVVPADATVTGCTAGDVIAVENVAGGRFWRVDGARAGTPSLIEVGRLLSSISVSSIAFAHSRLFGIGGGAEFVELGTSDFAQIGTIVDLRSNNVSIGGLAFDGNSNWYIANADSDGIIRLSDPPTAASWTFVGSGLGVNIGSHGLEFSAGQLWMGCRAPDSAAGRLRIGAVNTTTGQFTQTWDVAPMPTHANMGFVAFAPECLDITRQPSGASTCPEGSAAFSLAAVRWGAGVLSYAWQIQQSDGTWATLGNDPMPLACPGGGAGFAFASPLDSPSVTIGVHGCPGPWNIRCIVSTDCGSTTSNSVALNICSRVADLDCDGTVSLPDLATLLAHFGTPSGASRGDGDIDGDGAVSLTDLALLLREFGTPCP